MCYINKAICQDIFFYCDGNSSSWLSFNVKVHVNILASCCVCVLKVSVEKVLENISVVFLLQALKAGCFELFCLSVCQAYCEFLFIMSRAMLEMKMCFLSGRINFVNVPQTCF